MLAKRNFGIGKSVVYPYPTSWNIDTKKIREEYCGFWSNKTLHYFPLSVRP